MTAEGRADKSSKKANDVKTHLPFCFRKSVQLPPVTIKHISNSAEHTAFFFALVGAVCEYSSCQPAYR
jgi:hypothetical protein